MVKLSREAVEVGFVVELGEVAPGQRGDDKPISSSAGRGLLLLRRQSHTLEVIGEW